MRRNKIIAGFTLIELLACLGIIGMAGVLCLAQFRTRRQEKLALAARQIMAQLIAAQSQAIDQRTPQIARFDSAAESQRLGNWQSGAPAAATVDFDGQDAVAFDEFGMPYSYCRRTQKLAPLSAGSVVVQYGTARMTVRVLPISGEIQVQ